LQINDAYILKFGFPLRVNVKVVAGCTNFAGSVTYGDAYYHETLRIVVCLVGSNTIPANAIPTAATLRLKGFYTPWYALTASELKVDAIASYRSSFTSEYIRYFDSFPVLNPRYASFAATSRLEFTPVLPHSTACQRNDYVIKIQLENAASSTNANLQYTQMIALSPPAAATADYAFFNTDCKEHTSSTVEVLSCRIDPSTPSILITILPGYYTNEKMISIETKGLAVRNPCLAFSGSTNAQWTAYFLSFENSTAVSQSLTNAYLVINSLNMASISMNFGY
jgi:hypothetical protein